MNVFNIKKSFEMKVKNQWPEIYVVVDLHGTIIPSGRSTDDMEDTKKFYDGALEVLQWFSKRKDIFLILWTATPSDRQKEIDDWFVKNGIKIDFYNKNPHAKNTPRSDFSEKFYFNILIDDRAGFEPETDWTEVKNELIKIGEWNRYE